MFYLVILSYIENIGDSQYKKHLYNNHIIKYLPDLPHMNSNISMFAIVPFIKEGTVRLKKENHLQLSALTLSSDRFLR